MHLVDFPPCLFGLLNTWLTPLWTVGIGAAGGLALLFVVGYVLRLLTPKVAAIAQTTAKEGMSHPLFYVILAIGVFLLIVFPFVSYNTFGEDVKMLKAEGLTLIKVLAIILALWTASVSIADEIEGRTALTLLSKPVGRRQLIMGKFLGILVPVAIVFIVLGVVFLASVSFKVVYDARETAATDPTAADCLKEMGQVAPGLGLAFMEAVVLASLSVAISTRLSMLPNLVICAAVYVMGYLVPTLVTSSAKQFPLVNFVGRLLAAVLPGLEYFSMETSISTGQFVPPVYLAAAAVYCVLYSAAALLLALLLFEERDLA
jgi:ABC-type transport system involved in multi-copper enzyme maturation permease subunit